MRRREFLILTGGAAAAWPHLGRAQQGKVYKVGLLIGGFPTTRPVDAFVDEMRRLGYIEGQNLAIELRAAESRAERVPMLAAELVALQPDVIIARSTPTALALKHATTSIPIVFVIVTDPVGTGLIRSLAHPGGNITGVTDWAAELGAKHVEMITEMVPNASRMAVLWNPRNPANTIILRDIEKALTQRGLATIPVSATSPDDLPAALEQAAAGNADALIVASDTVASANRQKIIEFLAQKRMPGIFPVPSQARGGALIAYGVDDTESYRHAARLVARILKGGDPAELPAEEPDRFELVINLRTAKALGLVVPASLLARADEVVE
ncbi:putative ABC transport system substrate-binding protein [Rhizobiales bacterium GAS113]|nr:putative ABC transport system substrate-binding protein [Rhizobiales bacterium GAS113]